MGEIVHEFTKNLIECANLPKDKKDLQTFTTRIGTVLEKYGLFL